MQMPPREIQTLRLLDDYGEHHDATLFKEPELGELAARFRERQYALQQAYTARHDCERAITRQEALAFAIEGELEDSLRELETVLREREPGAESSECYLRAFPRGLEGALIPVGRDQCDVVTEIEQSIVAIESPEGDLKALLGKLSRQSEELLEAVEELDGFESELSGAFAKEQVEKRKWRDQYRKDYGLLIARFDGDRRRVERFFK